MAVSAFKSSSRRGNWVNSSTKTTSSEKESKQELAKNTRKAPLRRSRSVSAFSRTQLEIPSSDFLIKRDNPLFSTNNSPPAEVTDSKFGETPAAKSKAASAEDTRRGRSVSRNADAGKPNSGIGRSLSRVDTGRRHRSVSRRPVSRGQYVNSESEVEQEDSLLVNYRDRNSLNTPTNNGEKSGLVRSSPDMLDQMKSLRTSFDHRLAFEPSDGSTNLSCMQTPNWDDVVSTSSFSEAEEKTINAVCEQMKSCQRENLGGDACANGIYETVRSEVRRAISDIQNDLESAMQRTNTTAIASTSVADIPPELVSPGAVELVLDIRREYTKKLEQSQERARKLQEDLAVEEHRGLELSRILKEVLPDPKPSNGPKSRPGRKSSIERRKMSKRLTEEAMTYFDECVSLSTFDSSDFSSPEDPPVNLVGDATLVGDLAHASTGVPATYSPNDLLIDKQKSLFAHGQDPLELMASSSSKERLPQANESVISTEKVLGRKFSFSCRPSDSFECQQDIMNYVRNFEKGVERVNIDRETVTTNHFDLDDYNLRASEQNLLFDRVLFKNRLEFGSLLLCGGGIAFSSSPFASII